MPCLFLLIAMEVPKLYLLALENWTGLTEYIELLLGSVNGFSFSCWQGNKSDTLSLTQLAQAICPLKLSKN